jgi:predicted ATP-grasp superfamily ATP-dependent carboligase
VERAPSAVVLGVGGAAGVSAIRLLGRRGIRVYAVDHQLSPLGFHSRYAIPRRVPDPVQDEPGFAVALRALGDELGGEVPILPARDEDLNALARARRELGNRFVYPFPSWEILGEIQQKRFQVRHAARLGLSIPNTVDNPADVERFPVLVKPSRPAGFRARFRTQALRCNGRSELAHAVSAARAFDPLIQEVIPGPDRLLFTLGVYLDAEGSPLGVFCGRKLRQSPRGVGTCRVGEALWNDTVVEQGVRLLRELAFTGIAQVEFKYDPRDEQFKFIEINPRLWQWHENAAVCGVDFPWIAYQHLSSRTVGPLTSRDCRKRWALTFYDSLAPACTRPRYVDPFLARDDPRLAISHLARVARATLARARD